MPTYSSMERDINGLYQLGINAYMIKPFGLEDFIKVIKELGVFWALINKTT